MLDLFLIATEVIPEVATNTPPYWIMAASAAFGGFGIKVIDAVLKRGEVGVDEATQIRQELRAANQHLRQQLKEATDLLNETRLEFYDLQFEYETLKLKYNILKVQTGNNASDE